MQLALPGVQRGPARLRAGRAAGAVDDLVRGPHVAVQGMRRGPDLAGQAPRGPVVGRVVAPVHPPARLVRLVERVHPCDRSFLPMDGGAPARPHAALRHGQGRGRQDDRSGGTGHGGRRPRPPHDRLRGGRAGPRLARVRPRGRAARAGDRARAEPVGDQRSTRPRRCASGWSASSAARRCGSSPARRPSSTSSRPRPAPRSSSRSPRSGSSRSSSAGTRRTARTTS